MITKLAFLPRLLPGIFHRSVAATVGSYRMPSNRAFFYGVSVSAVLHAAVLFGINRGPETPLSADGSDIVVRKNWPDPLPVDLTPPPPPEPAKEAKDKPEDKPVAVSEDYARLPTPLAPPIPGAMVLPGDRPDLGKIPDKNSFRWAPPSVPAGPGAGNGFGKVFSTVDLDKVPVATSRAAPRYPFEMKREGRSGTVVMRFVVDSRGEVSAVEIISASSPEFAREATTAMLRWKFKAGMKDGKRVATLMEMPMEFSLEKNS